MKILLIEDDAATVETIRICTEIYCPKSELIALSQGLPAVERLRNEHFDIALIDLGLPDIDGLEVLKQIRTFSNLPVIIISARHSFKAASVAQELGACDYITKPFDFHVLIKRISEITDQKSPL